MSFKAEKKESIILYLLEKLSNGDRSAVKKTAEVYETTPATIYKYLKELEQSHVIRKLGRDRYELVTKQEAVTLQRSAGELTSEQTIFERVLKPHVQDLPENVRQSWEYIFSEMVNNIIDHSAAEKVLVLLIKDYLKTVVCLCDDGIGIFEKIKAYFSLDSIEQAVNELFKGKLTTDAKNHSGEGIFFSSRLADRFWILSSDKVFSHNKFDAEGLLNIIPLSAALQGTCVLVMLSNRTKRTPAEVFDMYTDSEDGFSFSKTQIPISSYFESAPVSRSQAKRLCTRLNEFKQVELDFNGVSWMGQGFAHQLFVVFQNENPKIKLIPTNMNEATQKMYRHVISEESET